MFSCYIKYIINQGQSQQFFFCLFVRMQVLQMAGVWQGRHYDAPALAVHSNAPADSALAVSRQDGVPSMEVSHV